jgi:ligand-binding SRPBCC domain-containing protein
MATTPVYRLDTSLWLPRPRPAVFEFFANAANLERITPPFLAFRILTPVPVAMAAGARIDYRIGLRGLPMTWQSEITVWDPPRRFVDAQLRGPYRLWEHTHTFEDRDDGTMVVDSVRYALPGPAFASAIVNRLIVARDLTRIFEYRHHALEDAFSVRGQTRSGPVLINAES